MKREQGFASQTKMYADMLIPVLRFVAEKYGYALAVHGSLAYDIDLVACPWRESPCSQESVAQAIREVCEVVTGYKSEFNGGPPTKKPNGRLAWAFHLTAYQGNGPYIDLSVMPSVTKKEEPCTQSEKDTSTGK